MEEFERMWDFSSKVEVNPFDDYMEDIGVVINTVGPTKLINWEHSRRMDLEVNQLLVSAAKKHKVDTFILVTSMFITRPTSTVAFILNSMLGMTLQHKLTAENILRQSGLNYVILRPGQLTGNKHSTQQQHR